MVQRTAVLRRVLGNPRLRRLELAFLGFGVAEYGVWVAVLVYAYKRGGTTMAAAIAVLQLLPAAIVAPVAAGSSDRWGGAVVLRIGYVVQALAMGASAAALLLGAPSAVVYAGAAVAASAVTLTRPAQGALLPALVESPGELTAANVVSGWVESVSVLLGPALAGGLIGVDGPGAAFALFAGAVAGSALLVAPLARTPVSQSVDDGAQQLRYEGTTLVGVLRLEPRLIALVAVVAVQFVAVGALDVVVVVLALKVLALGAGGAGYLTAAFGAGGVLGGAGALLLVGRHRLVGPMLGAAIIWGVALLVLGAWPTTAGAFVLLVGAGASRTVLDVSGRTNLHRVVPREVHGRAFGMLEGLAMVGLAVGSISVPVLVEIGGVQAALAGVGGLLVALALTTAPALRSLERATPAPSIELALLRGSALFSSLAAPVLEGLARAMFPQSVAAEQIIVSEGETGDRFYMVADGKLEVSIRERYIRTLGHGDSFGEIALLRDGMRTATVTAREPATLYALEREPFLEAVTGSHRARRAAEDLVAERLGSAAG